MRKYKTAIASAASTTSAILLSAALLTAVTPLRAAAEEAPGGEGAAIVLSGGGGVGDGIEVVGPEAKSQVDESPDEVALDGAAVADVPENAFGLLSHDRADAPAAGANSGSPLETALTAQSGSNIASGMWGTCPWEISSDGVLTIHPGEGVEANRVWTDGEGYELVLPWTEWVDDIISVRVVAEGGRRVVAPCNCSYLFEGMNSLVSADLSRMDTSLVNSMSHMFAGCTSLVSLNASGWDTSSVESMGGMFWRCFSLTAIDLSGWDTSSVRGMCGMFGYCSSLVTLDVSGWDTSRVIEMDMMFLECSSLTFLDVSGWDTSSVDGISYYFESTGMDSMFEGCSSLVSLDVSDWDTSRVIGMADMFYNCSSLASLDVSGWDTSQVTSMGEMFYNCSSLASLDVSGWDTSRVQRMYSLFHGCSSLTLLDVSGWNTSQVEWMDDMFSDCSSLVSIDASGWDTSQVGDMRRMFSGCSSLTSVDVSGWDTSRVCESYYQNRMFCMFIDCALDEFRVGAGYVVNENEVYDGIPASRAADRRWWSERDGAWYTRGEVAARSGVADTYLSEPDEAPALARDGWVDLPRGGKGYVRNGALVKGWFDLGSSKYWFHPSGRMARGWTDVEVNGNLMHYYFNPNSGNLVRNTWFEIDGRKYYFRPSGNMATGWATISDAGVDKKYYFDERGRMLTGWRDIDTGQGYVGRYYLRPSGAMATGWATIDGEKYWFRPSGNMATGFADVDDAYKRYFEESGRMTTGWRRIGSSVYYFRPSGAMQTGQATIDGAAYTFSAKGVLSGEPPAFAQKPDYAHDMALGRTSASAGEGESWYGWFVAPSAGTYVFYSEGDYDTYGTLYAEDGETYLDHNDDWDGCNFHIERELAAGEAVVLEVRQYSYGSFECDVLAEAGAASMLASRPSNASPVLVLGDGAEGDGGRDELPLALDGASPPGSGSDAAGSGADEPADLSEVLADEADAGLVDALPSDTPGEVVELGG